jgi:hypothetical protein
MRSQSAVQRFVSPRRSVSRESSKCREVTYDEGSYAKTPAPLVAWCSPTRCCSNHSASALNPFDRSETVNLSDCCHSLVRSSPMTKFPRSSAVRARIPAFCVDFLWAGRNSTIRQLFFIQINERATVDTNIEHSPSSAKIRQHSRGESEMTTAANSTNDRCNTSLTA